MYICMHVQFVLLNKHVCVRVSLKFDMKLTYFDMIENSFLIIYCHEAMS